MAADTVTLHVPSTGGDLPSDWHWDRLDRVCQGVFDCPHSTPTLAADGPLIARSQDIRSGVFRVEEAARVTEGTYGERVVRAAPRYGDLLYSREGTYFGIAAEVPRGVRVCLGQRMVLIRPDERKVQFRFLRYWLNSPVMTVHILGHRDGSVAERLNLPTIRGLPVALPPLPEQQAIAEILGALDNKIELNRRMSATLEAMARAIFKSWFVDFDPVHAKLDGRDGGFPRDLADLFPDHLVNSEVGEIPKGWSVRSIGELAEVVGGSTPSTTEPAYWLGGRHHWVTPKDLAALRSPVLLDTERLITDAGLSQIGSGLLPVGTVLLSSRAPIGYLAISEIPVAINQGFIAMRPRPGMSSIFLMLWAGFAHDDILARANGSTFLEISKTSFRPIPVPLPDDRVLGAFDERVRPLYLRIVANERAGRTLAALRGTLLPRLVSGELRIADAERIVGKHV